MSDDDPQHRTAFEAHLGRTKETVDRALAEFLAEEEAVAVALRPDLAFAAGLTRDLALRGGKRFRAALLSSAFLGFGGESLAACTPALVALELLQVYLLIHDDWMDGDDTRRGGKSVPAALRDRYGAGPYADAAAILAGDYACAIAQKALAVTDLPRVGRAFVSFATMQRDVVFGQMLDTAPPELEPKGAAGETASVERTYLLKTGSYTVRGPLELGAILAGASSDALARIARFAEPLGVAFQLRDDLLSTFGTERTTGKPAHGDLRTGKRTWLMAAAMKDARVRDAMPGAFGVAAATEERLLRLAEAIEASGAKTAVEARLATLAAEARAALPALGLSSDMERVLSGAVVALTERAS